jgi:surface-anchored protein
MKRHTPGRTCETARLVGTRLLALLTIVIAPTSAVAQTALTGGEIDIEFEFDGSEFEVVLVDTTSGTEFEPDEAFFFGGPSSIRVVPDDPAFSFLGAPGSFFHLFPQIEDPTIPFIGLSTDELPPGTFVGEGITLSLDAVTGPGHFALYQTDPFGTPTVFYNTRDGIDASDSLFLAVGIDDHFNWAFSEPGDYFVSLIASAELIGGGSVVSPLDALQFQVVPEPSVWTLLVPGVLGIALVRRRGTQAAARQGPAGRMH